MLDKLMFRVVPAALLIVVALVYYPPTAGRIRKWVSLWYYSRPSIQATPVSTP